MALDICRFIEIRKSTGWVRLKWGKELGTNDPNNASHFNNGKDIMEWWLDTTGLCNNGIPEDSDSKEIYKSWGYQSKWATLHMMESAAEDYEHALHQILKSSRCNKDIQEILKILKKESNEEFYPEEFYSVYPFNDYAIEDKFDDNYACGMLKLDCIRRDIATAKGIVEACAHRGYLIDSDDIRIIFVYNN